MGYCGNIRLAMSYEMYKVLETNVMVKSPYIESRPKRNVYSVYSVYSMRYVAYSLLYISSIIYYI